MQSICIFRTEQILVNQYIPNRIKVQVLCNDYIGPPLRSRCRRLLTQLGAFDEDGQFWLS